jgi:uncharacterized protein (DUF302 family)
MRTPFYSALVVVLCTLSLSASPVRAAVSQAGQTTPTDVYKIAIDRNISLSDAADSMRLRANALNIKLVAELALSKQVEAVTDQSQRTITIFQFCDALTAKDLIDLNLDFSVYMPCRIALIEDTKGQGWLVMLDMNVDTVTKTSRLPSALKNRIESMRQSLLEIMQAGAKGEL